MPRRTSSPFSRAACTTCGICGQCRRRCLRFTSDVKIGERRQDWVFRRELQRSLGLWRRGTPSRYFGSSNHSGEWVWGSVVDVDAKAV